MPSTSLPRGVPGGSLAAPGRHRRTRTRRRHEDLFHRSQPRWSARHDRIDRSRRRADGEGLRAPRGRHLHLRVAAIALAPDVQPPQRSPARLIRRGRSHPTRCRTCPQAEHLQRQSLRPHPRDPPVRGSLASTTVRRNAGDGRDYPVHVRGCSSTSRPSITCVPPTVFVSEPPAIWAHQPWG